VHFTSSDGQAIVPADSTLSNGAGTFSATLRTAGNQTITATDTTSSTLTGTSNSILVSAAAASHFAVSAPASAAAGSAISFTVTAQDSFNNTATGYTGTVHFSSSDPKAILPANYTFTGGDAGIHVFSGTLKTAGSQSITATDTVTGSISGTQAGITVNPATTNHLVVSRFPPKTTAGVSQSFRVTAQDMFGNTTPGFADTVRFTSSDAPSVLPGSYTFTSGDAGAQTFSATLNTQGTQSIIATDTVNAGIMGTETGIMVVSVQPTASISGPSIGVPGQPLIFNLDASESGPSAGPPYTYTVHWGDGSPDQRYPSSNSTSAVMASH